MNKNYYEYIVREMKLKPVNETLGSQVVQDIECLLCGNVSATSPKSKYLRYKQFGFKGCYKCTIKEKYKLDTERILTKLNEDGFILHEPYEGNKKKTMVSNSKCCNRMWRTRLDFVLQGKSFCRPCNDDSKRKRLEEANEKRYKEAAARLQGCDRYRLTVRYLSEKVYRANMDTLNPKGRIRKRNGQKNAVHLDHIVPIVWCFRNNIPEDICAHPDNLRIINSKWNAKKWSKLPPKVPDIFKPFIKS